MRKFFKKKLREGLSINTPGFARGLQAIAYALENMEVINGRVEWTNLGALRLIYNGGSDAAATPKPYDLELTLEEDDSTTATLSNCYHLFKGINPIDQSGELSKTLADEATIYIGVEVQLSTGVADIVTGTSLSDVGETEAISAEQNTMKMPLYVLEGQVNEDSIRVFSVSVDLRNMPVFPGWI